MLFMAIQYTSLKQVTLFSPGSTGGNRLCLCNFFMTDYSSRLRSRAGINSGTHRMTSFWTKILPGIAVWCAGVSHLCCKRFRLLISAYRAAEEQSWAAFLVSWPPGTHASHIVLCPRLSLTDRTLMQKVSAETALPRTNRALAKGGGRRWMPF